MLPVRIDPCPIIEAVAEVRFSTSLPADAVFGIVYANVKQMFPEVQNLPILQIPEIIRKQDANLKYQPNYVLKKDVVSLKVGPRVLTFSNVDRYMGWSNFFPTVASTLNGLKDTNVIKVPERISIRYINLFEVPILKHLNVQILLNGGDLADHTTNLRTEMPDGEFLKIIQIANNVGLKTSRFAGRGSLFDIDCIYSFQKPDTDFYALYEQIIQAAHDIEKETFFSLLDSDFLEKLNPVYREE